ncbi:MAG TPA: metal-dependent hydrolase [Myxococcales bacterium]|jgi:L-ascorbate metabolism protein UlaG (beta-lactamase superfamily)
MHRLLIVLAALLPLSASAAAAEKPKTELTWYGQSAFIVKTPKGKLLAIDPWLSNPVAKDKDAAKKIEKLDYILVTHAHSDHVGDAVALGQKTHAKLVSVFELSNLLAGAGYPKDAATMATGGNMGGTFKLDDEISVTLVPALHSSSFQKAPDAEAVYAGNPVGFVIQIKDGPTLYHTGDTDVTGDMKLLGERFKIDVMLACIGGHFTMDPKGAATAATLVKPKQIVPMHFGTFPLLAGTPAELKAALKDAGAKATMVEMQVGETKAF